MSTDEFQDRVFKALADSKRRKILDLLRDRARTTGDICNKFPDLDRCTVMQHLNVLSDADLVIIRKEGRYKWNHLNIDPINSIYRRWVHQYAQPSANLLSKLKANLED